MPALGTLLLLGCLPAVPIVKRQCVIVSFCVMMMLPINSEQTVATVLYLSFCAACLLVSLKLLSCLIYSDADSLKCGIYCSICQNLSNVA